MNGIHFLESHHTLVVMDCQAGCLADSRSGQANRTADHFVDNIAGLCLNAVRGGEQVAIVEYVGLGETHPRIMEAVRKCRRLVTVKKDRPNVLDATGAYFTRNLRTFSALRDSRAALRLVGLQASDCVSNSAWGFHRSGILCRTLAHGILDHVANASWDSYRSHNDLDRIRAFYCDVPEKISLLDESRAKRDGNLVDVHARLVRERSAMLLTT